MSILTILRARKPETAAELQEAHNGVIAELKEARAGVEALEKRRDDLVLDGTDQQIEKADADIAAASRRIRDLDIARARLAERHIEAVAKEQRDGFAKAAKVLNDRAAKLPGLMVEAHALLTRAIELKREYDEADASVGQHNDLAVRAGLSDLKVDSAWSRIIEAFEPIRADRAAVPEPVRHILMVLDEARRREPLMSSIKPAGPVRRR